MFGRYVRSTFVFLVVLITLKSYNVESKLEYQSSTETMKDGWTRSFGSSTISITSSMNDFLASTPVDPDQKNTDDSIFSWLFDDEVTEETSNGKVISHPRVKWIPIGHRSSSILEPLIYPFDAITLLLSSSHDMYVYWSDFPPDSSIPSVINRVRCQQPFWPLYISSTQSCAVTLPKYGLTAPLGRSYIGYIPESVVTRYKQSSNSIVSTLSSLTSMLSTFSPEDPINVTIEYRTHKDWLAVIRLVLGIFLFLISSHISHSRYIHVITGVSLGTIGVTILLIYILLQFIPGKRKVIGVSAFFGLTATVGSLICDALLEWIDEYRLVVFIICGLGSVVGGIIAYKYQLDNDSMDIIEFLLKMVSLALVVSGSHNIAVSIVIVMVLLIRWFFNRQKEIEVTSIVPPSELPVRKSFIPMLFDNDEVNNDMDYDSANDSVHIDDRYDKFYQNNNVLDYDDDHQQEHFYHHDPSEYSDEEHYQSRRYSHGVRDASPQSPSQYELEGRLYTQQALRDLRLRAKHNEDGVLVKLSARALHALAKDTKLHEASDEEWFQLHHDLQSKQQRRSSRVYSPNNDEDEYTVRKNITRRLSQNANRGIGSRYHDIQFTEDEVVDTVQHIETDIKDNHRYNLRSRDPDRRTSIGQSQRRQSSQFFGNSGNSGNRDYSSPNTNSYTSNRRSSNVPVKNNRRESTHHRQSRQYFSDDWDRLFDLNKK